MYCRFKNFFIKTICLTALLLFTGTHFFAQTSDDQYSQPLKEVLDEIQVHFNIKLDYSEELVKDRSITYAGWRLRTDVEKSLTNVLLPLDMVFYKTGDNTYVIENFRYCKTSIEDGREKLISLLKLYSSKEEWELRKVKLRKCMIDALGIVNLSGQYPLAVVAATNKRNMNGYSIENIALETIPGLYVCCSVYQPLKTKGKIPAVLCPNGHFSNGRYNADVQTRCAMLARMGAIAVSYDLFAWGESLLQFKPEDHRKSLAMTIQVLNTLKILDYLFTIKNVDTSRIAITGGSGGGSHSMLIAAIDERIKVSVPVVMLSAHFYGGCPCESGKPVHLCGGGTCNPEIAAMAAPRPQLVISDGKDWTAQVPEIEFPYLQKIYSFYEKEDAVKNVHFADEGHDYGFSKRCAMYEFIALHLGMDIEKIKNASGTIDESMITIENKEAMYVFSMQGEKLPANAIKSFEELETIYNKYKTSGSVYEKRK
jgi:dienelactone hydrolase